MKMVWNQLKHHALHLSIYTSQPAKVIDLLRNVWDQKILRERRERIPENRSYNRQRD